MGSGRRLVRTPRRRTARHTNQPPRGHAAAPVPARTPAIARTPGKNRAMHPRPVTGRWTAAAYTCLMVALVVAEPAIVSLTVHDHVQLDRLTGTSAERYGDLMPPGTTPSASPLEPGDSCDLADG